jgi:hypothetical protein
MCLVKVKPEREEEHVPPPRRVIKVEEEERPQQVTIVTAPQREERRSTIIEQYPSPQSSIISVRSYERHERPERRSPNASYRYVNATDAHRHSHHYHDDRPEIEYIERERVQEYSPRRSGNVVYTQHTPRHSTSSYGRDRVIYEDEYGRRTERYR